MARYVLWCYDKFCDWLWPLQSCCDISTLTTVNEQGMAPGAHLQRLRWSQDKRFSHFQGLGRTFGRCGFSFSFWNIIKQGSKAFCARGEKSGNAIMLSLMSIWTTWSCHSAYVLFSPFGFMCTQQDAYSEQARIKTVALPLGSFLPLDTFISFSPTIWWPCHQQVHSSFLPQVRGWSPTAILFMGISSTKGL